MTTASLVCDATQSTLVVIDVQERLVSAMAEKVVRKTILHTQRLIQAANLLSIPVVSTEQYPKGLGATVAPLASQLTTTAFNKTCFSCCGVDDFRTTLSQSNRPQVVLTGMESHVCVLQTTLELISHYQVFVVADAVCSRNKHHHQNALARLQQAGVIISNHESVMFEWLRDASHPQFKAVSALVR